MQDTTVATNAQTTETTTMGGVNQQTQPKEWLVTLLLCIFVGGFGVHRFYTGHTVIGVIQLFTLGACGIWTIIDFVLILTGSYKDSEGRELIKK